LSIGVPDGIGLSLLLWEEFSGTHTTVFAAIFVVISLVSMGLLSYKTKKNTHTYQITYAL